MQRFKKESNNNNNNNNRYDIYIIIYINTYKLSLPLFSMKGNKLITLDVEIIEKLKDTNASKLVNSMLMDYFYSGGGLEKEELKGKIVLMDKEIFDKKAQKDILKAKLKDILDQEAEFKKIFKGMPVQVLEDFKAFPKMTEEILQVRFRELYSDTPDLTWYNVLEAYNKYFKKANEK